VVAYLALVLWASGQVDEATRVAERGLASAKLISHVPTLYFVHVYRCVGGAVRRNPEAIRADAEALETFASSGIPYAQPFSTFFWGWINASRGERALGIDAMRKGNDLSRDQALLIFSPLRETLLAEAEAEAGEIDVALNRLDVACAEVERTGQRWYEADMHRVRAEVLLKRDHANMAAAEEGFLRAIAIARQQKAGSFELRAALALAKLFQSTGRAADAHAVLAPALEGFSPTPELPEIAEAQTFLVALAEMDEVKNAAAARRRRLKLQTSYGQAMLQARGQHSPETQQAFERARELAGGDDDPLQRFSTYYGLWVGGLARSEKSTLTEAAEALLKEAEARPDSAEASIANRVYGTTCWVTSGDFATACEHYERSLYLYRPERDREHAYRFAWDSGVATKIYLSLALWALGEPDRARAVLTRHWRSPPR
jgi:predicted ATPase